MARFDADTNGAVIQLVESFAKENDPHFGAKPPGTVFQLQFDEETNHGLIVSYGANPAQYSMPGGTLTQTPPGGQPVAATINEPKPFYDGFMRSAEIMAGLSGNQAAIAAAAFRANGIAV